MIDISLAAKLAKNSLSDTGSWLVFLDIANKDKSIEFKIVSNTEDITRNSVVYTAFPFELNEMSEATKGNLPTLSLKVSNVGRLIGSYIETDPDFGSGWSVKLEIAHTSNINASEIYMEFVSLSSTVDENFVTFTIGMANPIRMQSPRRKFMPNYCQHTFKRLGCTYAGTDTTCDKTIVACRAKFAGSTKIPFLGFPGIPTRAIYA